MDPNNTHTNELVAICIAVVSAVTLLFVHQPSLEFVEQSKVTGSALWSGMSLFTPTPLQEATPVKVWGFTEDAPQVHYFDDESISLRNITVKVVYFMPQNSDYKGMTARYDDKVLVFKEPNFGEWTRYFNEIIPLIEQFHSKEFNGLSTLQFTIFPEIVRGLHDKEIYEEDFIDIDRSEAAPKIESELQSRIFNEEGDLYDFSFAQKSADSFSVLLVVYVTDLRSIPEFFGAPIAGAASEEEAFTLIFSPVVDPNVSVSFLPADLIIYHELMHAFGVPEQYDLKSANPLEQARKRDDVMGFVDNGPLDNTYIDMDIKTRMGL